MAGPGTWDLALMLLCYGYIVALILVSGRLEGFAGLSGGASRKFLHAMIGNLVLAVPFFQWRLAPVLIAAPFILVTYVASPYTPMPGLREKMGRLADLTEEGHHAGLILYSISFTLLVALFPNRPDVVAAGVLPMAYGDSSAALVGRRMGKKETLNGKTLEGSIALFVVTLISLIFVLAFISSLWSFPCAPMMVPAAATAFICMIVEAMSPRGLDNITVPILGALTFYLARGVP